MGNNLKANSTTFSAKSPGRIKITEAVKELLGEKSYHEITWGEIAKKAEVSEALIYQHFKHKPGLLCGVLEDFMEAYVLELKQELKGVYGALNKLQRVIWAHIQSFNVNRVFAKILLLEIRGYPLFFDSGAYRIIQSYGDILLDIIKEGVYYGEISEDIPPKDIRQIVLGTIEHQCLPRVIFDIEFSTDNLTDMACQTIFNGIMIERGRA